MPVGDPKQIDLVGSKVALSLAALELGITTPRFQMAYSSSGLAEQLNDWDASLILKADFGAAARKFYPFPANPS